VSICGSTADAEHFHTRWAFEPEILMRTCCLSVLSFALSCHRAERDHIRARSPGPLTPCRRWLARVGRTRALYPDEDAETRAEPSSVGFFGVGGFFALIRRDQLSDA
jgi:hypothetical protein